MIRRVVGAVAASERPYVMRQKRRPILTAGCAVSTALFGLLLLQCAGIAPRLQTSWSDRSQTGAYLVWLGGSFGFQTATGLKAAPPNLVRAIQPLGDGLDLLGLHYHRWNDVTQTMNRTTVPGVYGTHSEFWIAPGWMMLLSLVMPSIWLRHYLQQRRLARNQKACLNCGYDLRATPDRCPECGRVPAEPAAA